MLASNVATDLSLLKTYFFYTEVVKNLNTWLEVWSYIPANNISRFCRVSFCIAVYVEQSPACIFTFYKKI